MNKSLVRIKHSWDVTNLVRERHSWSLEIILDRAVSSADDTIGRSDS
jgi:hypothetical protein